jgi:hypothetical protein
MQVVHGNEGIFDLDVISKKYISFSVNGVGVFQGCCIGVIVQI